MSYCHKTYKYLTSDNVRVGQDQVGKLFRIVSSCSDYDPVYSSKVNEDMRWLKEHAGSVVRVIDTLEGTALVELVDNPEERAWAFAREISPVKSYQEKFI